MKTTNEAKDQNSPLMTAFLAVARAREQVDAMREQLDAVDRELREAVCVAARELGLLQGS